MDFIARYEVQESWKSSFMTLNTNIVVWELVKIPTSLDFYLSYLSYFGMSDFMSEAPALFSQDFRLHLTEF